MIVAGARPGKMPCGSASVFSSQRHKVSAPIQPGDRMPLRTPGRYNPRNAISPDGQNGLEVIAMKATADAIVYAAAYIDSRDQREEFDDDDSDESAVSHIMAYLSHATPVEEDALAAAAERALKEERSLHHPQQDMIEFFSRFMEIMFGMDSDGNERAYTD